MVERVEHLSLRQLEQYRERRTERGEFLHVARHLDVCDACHRRFLELVQLPAQLNPLTYDAEADERGESFHLNYNEHLAPYVDGAINDIDREIVESHVVLCANCAGELRELFALREELNQSLQDWDTSKKLNHEITRNDTNQRYRFRVVWFVLLRVISWFRVSLRPNVVSSDLARANAPEFTATQTANDGRATPPSAIRREGFFNSWRGAFARWPVRAVAGVLIFALLISAAVLWQMQRAPSMQPDDNRAGVGRDNNTAQPLPETDGDAARANRNAAQANDNAAQANHNAPAPNDNATRADAPTSPDATKPTAPALRRDDASHLVVALNDGGRTLTLDRRNQLGGAADVPPAYRRLIVQALAGQRIETPPELASLRDRAGRLRGGADEQGSFALLGPAGTLTRTGQPVLRWQPLAGATRYTVKIYDADLNAVAVSPPLARTEWTPPAPLPPGAIYSWQVTAERDGATVLAPQAQESRALFKVLPPTRLEELQRAERIAGDSQLLRAIVYARFGLVDEAEGELRKLQKANARSALARRLAESLRRR